MSLLLSLHIPLLFLVLVIFLLSSSFPFHSPSFRYNFTSLSTTYPLIYPTGLHLTGSAFYFSCPPPPSSSSSSPHIPFSNTPFPSSSYNYSYVLYSIDDITLTTTTMIQTISSTLPPLLPLSPSSSTLNISTYLCTLSSPALSFLSLYPSLPHQLSTILSTSPQYLSKEFYTKFVIQFHSLSTRCTKQNNKDNILSNIFSTCNMDSDSDILVDVDTSPSLYYNNIGADGFAFIIQNSPSPSSSPSSSAAAGSSLGYTGIPDSIAVEFDFHSNNDIGDGVSPHISVHSMGKGRGNNADSEGNLSGDVGADMLDMDLYYGDNNTYNMMDNTFTFPVEIIIFPSIIDLYMTKDLYQNTPQGISMLGDPISSLCVFIGNDNLYYSESSFPSSSPTASPSPTPYVPTLNLPLFCTLISIPRLINMESGDLSYVGFTGTTGEQYGQVNILEWYACERADGVGC